MNSNSPRDETHFEGSRLPVVINLQKEHKTCIIKTSTGKKFPCSLADWLIDGIQLMDHVEIKKNHVSGGWMVVDYHVNTDVYNTIHNSYQTKYDDMICDERGVPL